MSGIHIDIRDKTYRTASHVHQAIAGLELHIGRNQFVCMVGPSGCGKTTLLNIIAGLDQQFQGRIGIDGAGQRLHIGYVFQNPRLLPWHTVRRNIELAFPGPPPTALIDELLDVMQLRTAQHHYPERLSLGMQRRVAIIRAFAVNPDLLLLDEPFVSLDAPTARQIRALLYALWRQRPHTVLFVTHDLREAIALADRLIFLSSEPMRVLADIPVDIPRDRRDSSSEIETFRQHLLSDYGIINSHL
ncbi:MAG: ATP-binding cassette domain-containing protein [Methylococcales bacterium]|nr:ATP-binding cassette domain-containing protein [Methylococcales bacterium]